MPSESVDMVLTSPPYWALRDYQTEPMIWGGNDLCSHHFRPERHATSGFCVICNAWRGELGLEPTFQLYLSHLCQIFDEVFRVLKKTGTCWVNLGDTYSQSGGGRGCGDSKHSTFPLGKKRYGGHKCADLPRKCLCLIPSRFAIEMTQSGWCLRNTIIWHKPNSMPSPVKDRFTVDFESLFFFTKNRSYDFRPQFEPSQHLKTAPKRGDGKKGRNKRCVWSINTKPDKQAHFAAFPPELCITPIKAGCPKNGIVLDPFFGTGTTGLVALKLGRKFIGIELNPKSIQIAKKRLEMRKGI